jgi:hypothetical protein
MKTALTMEGTFPLRRHTRTPGSPACDTDSAVPAAQIPRIARLLALARQIDALVQSGAIPSYAQAARLGHVSRARLSQILALSNLAPDLQEQLLFLAHPARGRAAPVLRQVLRVAVALDWDEQRRRWRQLRRAIKQHRAAVLNS